MSFDPQSFLDAAVTGANDTKIIPVPVGEYVGVIEKVSARQWQSKDGTKTGITLDVVWLVEDAGVKEFLGRPTVTVKQGVMLDIDANTGGLDMGKGRNVDLGRLREAIDKNDPNQPFSFAMLPGLMAKIQIVHQVENDTVYSKVKAVAKL